MVNYTQYVVPLDANCLSFSVSTINPVFSALEQ